MLQNLFLNLPPQTVILSSYIRTFCHFEALGDFCERNPKDAGAVEAELPVCRELCTLLPIYYP